MEYLEILISIVWTVLQLVQARDFTTGVVRSPHFTAEPQDLVLVQDPSGKATGTLYCEAGPLGAKIRWTLNNRPIAGAYSGNLSVGWSKDRKLSPGGQRKVNFGGGVNLTEELPSDAVDIYQCVAYNSVGSVISRPTAVSLADIRHSTPPQDVDVVHLHVIEGYSVLIPCSEIISNPPAVISFESSAGPVIPDSDRMRIITSLNSLLITSVRLSEASDYRCSATNPVSKQRLSDNEIIRLNVTGGTDGGLSPVKLVHTSPDKVYVTEGEPLTLVCLSEGHSEVTWKRYGGQLPQGRYEITPGLLQIGTTQKLDEGTYICETKNGLKDPIRHIMFVSVREPPVVIIPPADTTVSLMGSVSLSCKTHGSPKPVISWLHNTQPISGRKSYTISDSGSTLSIEQALMDHAGMYQCVAKSSLGVAQAAARLIVLNTINQSTGKQREERMQNNAPYEDTPRRKTKLDAEEYLKSRQSAKPSVIDSQSDFFTSTREREREQGNWRKRNPNFRRPKGSSALNSRSEAHQRMPSASDRENPESSTNGKETKHQPRAEQPPKLRVSLLSDVSVMIEWKKRKRLNGLRVLFVKLQYKNMDERKNKGWATVDEDISSTTESYTLSGLKPGNAYQFRLVHVYSNHDNKHGPKTRLRIPMNGKRARVAPPAPVIVKVQPISNSSIAISWQYIQEGRVTIDGFIVYYQLYQLNQELPSATHDNIVCGSRRLDGSDDLQVIVSNENVRDLVLHGLAPDTEYSICMQCFSGNARSQFSNTVVQRTLPGSLQESSTYRDSIILVEGKYSSHRPWGSTYEPPTDLAAIFKADGGRQADETLYMILGIILGIMVVLLLIGGVGCYCSQKYQAGHYAEHHYCKKPATGASFSSDMNMLASQRLNKEELKWLPSPFLVGSSMNRFIDQISNTDDIQGFANTGTERTSLSSSMTSHNSAQQYDHGRSHCDENDIYDRRLYTYDGDFEREDAHQSSRSTDSISYVSDIRNEEAEVTPTRSRESFGVTTKFQKFRGLNPDKESAATSSYNSTRNSNPAGGSNSSSREANFAREITPTRRMDPCRGLSTAADSDLGCRGFSESSLEDCLRNNGTTDHSDDSADEKVFGSSLTRCHHGSKPERLTRCQSRTEISSVGKSDLSLSDEDFSRLQPITQQYICSTL